MTGIFRYVRHADLLVRLAQGWQWIADLGDVHGEFCTLCWWCCGDCQDGEVAKISTQDRRCPQYARLRARVF
jgi:hypothetical protein